MRELRFAQSFLAFAIAITMVAQGAFLQGIAVKQSYPSVFEKPSAGKTSVGTLMDHTHDRFTIRRI